MILFIIASVTFFGIMTFRAESKAPDGYSTKEHTISELACQTYENRSIMQWGFKGLGIIIFSGIIISFNDSIKEPYFSIPLAMYAIFMFLSGVFSSKPFEHLVFYSIKESKLNSLFNQLAGLSLSLLIVMKFIVELGIVSRVINIFVLVFVLYISAQVGRKSDKSGFYQRILYFGCFLWLIYAYSGMMG